MSVWDILQGSKAAEGLRTQMASREVAHSWLLIGPAGSGKRPAALAMAAALNCPVQPGVGCGECSACTRIIKGGYPDVHTIAPEGPLIPVDVIREVVIPEASRSPFEGDRKVFIIEEAERMNQSAQNALLKTLEEPHADTVFILISDREEELLETIRSRCRIVHLEPVSEKRIVELLAKYGADEDTAIFAARLSEGDYEVARAFSFDEGVKARRSLWVEIPFRLTSSTAALEAAAAAIEQARATVGEREKELAGELARLEEDVFGGGRGTAAVRNQIAKRHKRELRRLEEEILGEMLKSVASFYRDVVAVRSQATDAITNLDLLDRIEAWGSSDATDAVLMGAVDRCIETRVALTRNANVPLAIEALFVELVATVGAPQAVRA